MFCFYIDLSHRVYIASIPYGDIYIIIDVPSHSIIACVYCVYNTLCEKRNVDENPFPYEADNLTKKEIG
jgi:hypothetical protein